MKIYSGLVDSGVNRCMLCMKNDSPIPVRFFLVFHFHDKEYVLVKVRVCDRCYLKVGITGTSAGKKMMLFDSEWDVVEQLEYEAKL